MTVLELGGGNAARPWSVNMDLYAGRPTVKADINQPFPFKNNSFETIYAISILEHVRLGNIIPVMREIQRVGEDGAQVLIRVPYWNSKGMAQDPTHQTPFTEETFYHFCGMRDQSYVPHLFRLVKVEFIFHQKLWFVPKAIKKKLMNLLSEVCTELWVTLRVVK